MDAMRFYLSLRKDRMLIEVRHLPDGVWEYKVGDCVVSRAAFDSILEQIKCGCLEVIKRSVYLPVSSSSLSAAIFKMKKIEMLKEWMKDEESKKPIKEASILIDDTQYTVWKDNSGKTVYQIDYKDVTMDEFISSYESVYSIAKHATPMREWLKMRENFDELKHHQKIDEKWSKYMEVSQ